MADREPIAFISYVRSDDDHDAGRISELRQLLEGEVKMQTGRAFHIFQDRNDIMWGQRWKERIDGALFDVTFLIPILTPSYFQSPACRGEFETFLIREKALGEDRLILPIYYVSSDEIEGSSGVADSIAANLKGRNWIDWRAFRFEPLTSPRLRAELAKLGATIKATMKDLEAISSAAKPKPALPMQPAMEGVLNVTPSAQTPVHDPSVTTVRKGEFDKKRFALVSREPYYAYTVDFDEVIAPSEVAEPADTLRFHKFLLDNLRRQLPLLEDSIAECAAEISNANKTGGLAISFLIDNSGSMRGQKILAVASWISVVSSMLSQAAIQHEVLGFTTRAWKGGQSRELWIADGKPKLPGRLNDLRHIVYKRFDQTTQEADTNFSVMLREGLLKENIDGEALLWAYDRLKANSAQRKLLFVISDGAPVDDSTLSVNAGVFLQDHLIAAINWIKSNADVELYGVGIEFDVSGFYGDGSPMLNPDLMGLDLPKVISLAVTKRWDKAGLIKRATEVAVDDDDQLGSGSSPVRRKGARKTTAPS